MDKLVWSDINLRYDSLQLLDSFNYKDSPHVGNHPKKVHTVNIQEPIKTIPIELFEKFTMQGKIPVQYWYFNNIRNTPVCNTKENYAVATEALDNKAFKYYDGAMPQFYDAFAKYSLRNKTVLIWGLAGCNCEAMAVWQQARHVYVVDYNKPICNHEKITVLSHEDLREKQIQFDCAISFSSFEHDGLGRYGDPISPFGDLEAMSCARQMLRDDGLLFLGVPLGKDALVWNAHRIYGQERLPLLLKGWRCLDVFSSYAGSDLFNEKIGNHEQPLLILQKTKAPLLAKGEILESIDYAQNLFTQKIIGTIHPYILYSILIFQLQALLRASDETSEVSSVRIR
jgi:hypothetical protein